MTGSSVAKVYTKGESPKAGATFWVRMDVQFKLDSCVSICESGEKTWTATVAALKKN